jgi:hypothetical protein
MQVLRKNGVSCGSINYYYKFKKRGKKYFSKKLKKNLRDKKEVVLLHPL